MIQALRPDRMLAMGQRVVGTILGENFMHDAEQGLDLASVVEHEVCGGNFFFHSQSTRVHSYFIKKIKNYCKGVDPKDFYMNGARLSSMESKVGITLYSIINSTTEKYCLVAFI